MAEKTVKPVETLGWDDLREIRLPRAAKGEPNYEFVAVNGKGMQVPKGKTVSVPYPIYERLMLKMEAEEKLDDYRGDIPNETV